MKKTKTDIEKKREKKLKDIEYAQLVKFENQKLAYRLKWESYSKRLIDKAERKYKAYINKKKLEYDRKCKNEIRKLEWKPERVYKKKKKTLNLVEFAMELMQENAKLRDTDISGNWICISCGKLKTRKELAWWHRYSRRIKNICLCVTNINAQCHWCNFTTWPRGDKIASDRVNAKYDENLDIKYWKWTNTQLRLTKESYFKNDYDGNWVLGTKNIKPTDKDIEKYIESLIEENRLRWKWKDFYSPSKKWKKIWDEYKSL